MKKKISPPWGVIAGHILWTQAELDRPIPGEDRVTGGNALELEPVGPNIPTLASLISEIVELDVARFIVRRAGFACEACGRRTFLRHLERWDYDMRTGIRRLKRMMCLCKQCQIASVRKLTKPASPTDTQDVQIRRNRGWTHEQLEAYYAERRPVFEEILAASWRSDISVLAHLALVDLPKPDDRIIIHYPRPAVKPPPDRMAIRFENKTFAARYREVRSAEDLEMNLAEARRLWPLIDELTAAEIAEKVRIPKFALYHKLGSRTASIKGKKS
jgi:hypothetical protein